MRREKIGDMISTKVKKTDFIDANGILHCGICGEPKEAILPQEMQKFLHMEKRSRLCACQREEREQEIERVRLQEHISLVKRLQDNCFQYKTFSNAVFKDLDRGSRQETIARRYVQNWEKVRKENIGLLFWGDVGTGKTYLASCIANALMKQEVSVKMVNFSYILNVGFEYRNELIHSLCHFGLLIIDDFGTERGTDYGLETVHSVLDARYNSGKPMIITTNLSLQQMKNPEDEMHKKIYDRTKNCVPVQFGGESRRQAAGKDKMEQFKKMLLEAEETI